MSNTGNSGHMQGKHCSSYSDQRLVASSSGRYHICVKRCYCPSTNTCRHSITLCSPKSNLIKIVIHKTNWKIIISEVFSGKESKRKSWPGQPLKWSDLQKLILSYFIHSHQYIIWHVQFQKSAINLVFWLARRWEERIARQNMTGVKKPRSLYSRATGAVAKNFRKLNTDWKCCPDNIVFDIFFELHQQRRFDLLALEMKQSQIFSRLLKARLSHLLHGCISILF